MRFTRTDRFDGREGAAQESVGQGYHVTHSHMWVGLCGTESGWVEIVRSEGVRFFSFFSLYIDVI